MKILLLLLTVSPIYGMEINREESLSELHRHVDSISARRGSDISNIIINIESPHTTEPQLHHNEQMHQTQVLPPVVVGSSKVKVAVIAAVSSVASALITAAIALSIYFTKCNSGNT